VFFCPCSFSLWSVQHILQQSFIHHPFNMPSPFQHYFQGSVSLVRWHLFLTTIFHFSGFVLLPPEDMFWYRTLCFCNFREVVLVVAFVQKKRAQTARLIGTSSSTGHIFSAVPTSGVVQSACRSPPLCRHPDCRLNSITTQCEYKHRSSSHFA
jgi:hypothetical protein